MHVPHVPLRLSLPTPYVLAKSVFMAAFPHARICVCVRTYAR